MPANRNRCWGGSALVAAMLALAATPAMAEGDLSERLTDQITEMHKLDFNRRLDSEFQKQRDMLGSHETTERSERLRELLKKRATIYEAVAEFDRAEADFNEMVDVRPQNPIVYSDRGYFYIRQSRYADAVRDFTTGSRLAPTQATFSYGAGRALALMGDRSNALQHYDEAIRLAPGDSVPVLARADLLLQLGEYAKARADYGLALICPLGRPLLCLFWSRLRQHFHGRLRQRGPRPRRRPGVATRDGQCPGMARLCAGENGTARARAWRLRGGGAPQSAKRMDSLKHPAPAIVSGDRAGQKKPPPQLTDPGEHNGRRQAAPRRRQSSGSSLMIEAP